MIVTRFAPSPTGRLHLGHTFSAVLGHDAARRSGGRFLLRIEDLDQGRSRPEFVDGIYEDMQWLGLEWDEPVLVQSRRTQAYSDALDTLRDRELVYACFCTRADIAQSLTAPHGDAATSYPGPAGRFPTIRSGGPRPRIAGGWIPLRRTRPWRCRHGRRPMGRASMLAKSKSATPSSRGRMPRRAITCPASSTMPPAELPWSFAAPTSGPRRRFSGFCRACSACPSPPIFTIRSSRMKTDGVSPSATSRRH